MESYRIEKILNQDLGPKGRLITGTKTGYCVRRPRNLVVFNANIHTKKGIIWWGDVDITLDIDILKNVAMNYASAKD